MLQQRSASLSSSAASRSRAHSRLRQCCTSASASSDRQAMNIGRRVALGMAGAAAVLGSQQRAGVAASASAASEMEKVLQDPRWPEKWPFRPQDFARYDEQPDTVFYDSPRFVTHIDDYAIAALTKHYGQVFPASGTPGTAILDICSSWVSHYPEGYKADKVAGLGMNGKELERNPQLTEWVVRDLNVDPTLPYPDNTFDVITNCVSVDYLNKPLEIFKEMHRVLKPGGKAHMSFSNRCFPTKAIQLWTATGDADHIWIVGSYFHYSVPGGFTDPVCADISPKLGMRSDPMYVVSAAKKA